MEQSAAPTQSEVAEELLKFAQQIDNLSHQSILAISMGTAKEVSNWRMNEMMELSAHVKAVAELYTAGKKAQYHLLARLSRQKNYASNYVGNLIKYLAWIWYCCCSKSP